MSDKIQQIIKAQVAVLADIATRLPVYAQACALLQKALHDITDHKWIARHLTHSNLRVVKAFNSDQETVDFKSINDYPLFRKEQAGDKRLSNVPRSLSQKTCLEIREAFLEAGRAGLSVKPPVIKTEVIESAKPSHTATDPDNLDFSSDPHGKDSLYRKAVKKAIQLFQAQYSMANCVRLACKDTGYPVKARVDRGFRSLLSEAELEERRMSAKSAHGFSSKPMTQSARSIYREIKVNESHFRDIVES